MEMLARQRLNTLAAYDDSGVDYDEEVLNDIVEMGLEKKEDLVEKLGNTLLVFERPKTNEELVKSSNWLKELQDQFLDYSFDFSHKQVTHRESGVCTSLKKWLTQAGFVDQQVQSLLRETEAAKELIISAHPWFLLGSSVGKDGADEMNSCHHPYSGTTEYKSGPISMALDSQTLMLGVWEDGGLTGRQLVYVDLLAPGIVAGRLYGDLSKTDSMFLRRKLYPFLSNVYRVGDWKMSKESAALFIYKNGYSGYLDSNYFTTYRPQRNNPVSINLAKAICPKCGEYHRDGTLLCVCCDDPHKGEEQCACCGHWECEEDTYYVDDYGSVCESCFHDRWFHCSRCDEVHTKDDGCITADGEWWCEYCAEKKGYVKCTNCDRYTVDYSLTVDGKVVCEECVERCSEFNHTCHECGAVGDSSDFVTTIEGNHFCDNCAHVLNECGDCGRCTEDDLEETADGGKVCSHCVGVVYIHECPGCHKVSEQPGACSQECATANLFDMGV